MTREQQGPQEELGQERADLMYDDTRKFRRVSALHRCKMLVQVTKVTLLVYLLDIYGH